MTFAFFLDLSSTTGSQSKEKCKAGSEAQIECLIDALSYFHDS